MARSAISLVRGNTKVFVNAVEHLPEVLRALEGSDPAQTADGHLVALASAQERLLDVAAQLLPGRKVKSLRDVAFFTRGKLQPSLHKRLTTLNTVYSFLRSTSEAAVLHTANQIADAMTAELLRKEPNSGLPERSKSFVCDDRSAIYDDSACDGTDASTCMSAPPTERGMQDNMSINDDQGLSEADVPNGTPSKFYIGETQCEMGVQTTRLCTDVATQCDLANEPDGSVADSLHPRHLFRGKFHDLDAREALEASSPSTASSSTDAPSPLQAMSSPANRTSKTAGKPESSHLRGNFNRHVPRGSVVKLVHDTCFPTAVGKIITIVAGKMGTFAGFDADGDAEVIFDSPHGAAPYFFGKDRFFHLDVLK